MTMTIKELADELGVSKQAIRKHLDKLPPTLPVTKKGGTIYLDPGIVSFVRRRVTPVTTEVDSNVTSKVGGVVTSDEKDRIDFLEKQIVVKDNQLENKDIQLDKMQKLLDQQQQLTLQANIKIKELETTLTETEPVDEETPTDKPDIKEEPIKKTFWQRFFQ